MLSGIALLIIDMQTLREAVDRGFDCVTVGDACAAADPDIHAAMLACISGEGGILGRVAGTQEILAAWSGEMHPL
jgi:nicotinamidase-related amidase